MPFVASGFVIGAQEHIERSKKYHNQTKDTLSFSFAVQERRSRSPPFASATLGRRARGVLASLTGFGLLFGGGRDSSLRKTFNSIDVDGKGHITAEDLEAFARRNGLPSSYASHFVSAVLATHNGGHQAGAKAGSGRQQQPDSPGGDPELTFALFKKFIRSREEALRRAFDLFDQDGDGRISLDDLDASLSRVAVCCPHTRSIYRCPSLMARQLLLKAAAGPAPAAGAGAAAAQQQQPQAQAGQQQAHQQHQHQHQQQAAADGRNQSAGTTILSSPANPHHPTAAPSPQPAATPSLLFAATTLLDAPPPPPPPPPPPTHLGFSEFRDFFLLLPQQDMMVEYWLAAGTGGVDLSDKLPLGVGGDGGARGSPWGHLLAGAIAGATSRTATAPLETLRLAAMAGQLQSRNLAQAASDIVSSQGWRGLYRGNLLNVMRSAPQKALDFFAFDAFKRLLGDDSHSKTFLAAGLAGVTSWVALYPLEVVRSRVTVAAASAAAAGAATPALRDALAGIVRREGLGALYKGLGPSVAAIFPEAAITYGLHDALKKVYTRVAHEEPGVAPSLAFGVFSAFMGQLVSFPLEAVSRRLQVAVGGAAAAGGPGAVAAVVREILQQGGPAALYRGIGAATLRLVPMACVSFGTYELVRSAIVAWEQRLEEHQVKQMLHSRCVPLVLEGPNGDHEVVGRVCTRPGGKPTLCPPSAGALCPARGTPLEKDPSSSSSPRALPLPLPLVPTGSTCTGGCPGTEAVPGAGAGQGAGSPLLPALAVSVTAVDAGAIAAGAGCGDCGLVAGGVGAAAAAAVAVLGGDAPDACVAPAPGAAPPCAGGGAVVLPSASASGPTQA